MPTVNILEAKTHLSRLVEQVESGAESEIVIARNGRPVARLVPLGAQPAQRRIGVAKGRFRVPDSIDDSNTEVERIFYGESNP
jgi:prevent-host-death family protein